MPGTAATPVSRPTTRTPSGTSAARGSARSATAGRGVDGMREVFATVLSTPGASSASRRSASSASGIEVVVLARHYGRRPSSGLEISDGGAYVIAMRDGKVAKFTFYPDKDEALEAVGLSLDEPGLAQRLRPSRAACRRVPARAAAGSRSTGLVDRVCGEHEWPECERRARRAGSQRRLVDNAA